MRFPQITIALPPWVDDFLADHAGPWPSVEERMRLVVGLSALNLDHTTGGPFAAAIFNTATGDLVAPGVNLVVSGNCSVAHAETVAIMTAQKVLTSHDLGAPGMPDCQLVSSTEPCAMCMGAIPWSGVRSLACGARGDDACAIGLDEGHKPADWVKGLEERGISVERDVCREDAVAVLRRYKQAGGIIYNGRAGVADTSHT